MNKKNNRDEPLDADPRAVDVDWKKMYISVDWDIASPFFLTCLAFKKHQVVQVEKLRLPLTWLCLIIDASCIDICILLIIPSLNNGARWEWLHYTDLELGRIRKDMHRCWFISMKLRCRSSSQLSKLAGSPFQPRPEFPSTHMIYLGIWTLFAGSRANSEGSSNGISMIVSISIKRDII